LIEDLER
jgi:hypothetical protein